MNNEPNTAEEILDKKVKLSINRLSKEERQMYTLTVGSCLDAIHESTAQTLDRLKEEVKAVDGYKEDNVELMTKDHVLQLIEEVSDE